MEKNLANLRKFWRKIMEVSRFSVKNVTKLQKCFEELPGEFSENIRKVVF